MAQYDPFAVQLFIGNEYVSSHQNVRDVINPSTLQPCGRVADATPAEIDRVLACAQAARPSWARLDYVGIARDDAGKVAGPIQSGSFQYARYSPYGARVHIVPYNLPILLMAWTLPASLAAEMWRW